MSTEFAVRLAERRDSETIAQFNRAMAWETEQRTLPPETARAGVEAVLRNPSLGFYVVAEQDGEIAGSLLITPEWSDWRNGVYWWIQSVYVKPACRRQGIYRQMYDYVRARATQEGNICGFRLYVEQSNIRAQHTYQTLGMKEAHYKMYEQLP